MNVQRTLIAVGAAALLLAPSAVFAQTPPPWAGDNHGWRDRERQRAEWERTHNGGYTNGNRNGYGNNGYANRGNALSGSVSSFSPFNLYLQNGTHVELHQGTVINPTGTTPQRGQRAQITGHWNSDGTFAADVINLR